PVVVQGHQRGRARAPPISGHEEGRGNARVWRGVLNVIRLIAVRHAASPAAVAVDAAPVDPGRVDVCHPDVHLDGERDDCDLNVAGIARGSLHHLQELMGGGLERRNLAEGVHRTGIVKNERDAELGGALLDGGGRRNWNLPLPDDARDRSVDLGEPVSVKPVLVWLYWGVT